MKTKIASCLAVGFLATASVRSQETPESFDDLKARLERQLQESVAELNALRASITDETLPLTKQLGGLEAQLLDATSEYQRVSRADTSTKLELSRLDATRKDLEQTVNYVDDLFRDYKDQFQGLLIVAERERYAQLLREVEAAPDNDNLSQAEKFVEQARLVEESIARIDDVLGGSTYEGTAIVDGLVEDGKFVILGPTALFSTGESVGVVDTRLGSNDAAQIKFKSPEDASAATVVVSRGEGMMPIDPTGGRAYQAEANEETFIEHAKKGGPVMVPILIMAAASLLVALWKWVALAFIRRPSRKRVGKLLEAVTERKHEQAREIADSMPGPTGEMLQVGVEHIEEPRELIEEVMYESVLRTKHRTQSLLPFIAICAAAAPLMGLLGTVTGIINTFKELTTNGAGDVKSLSGGISEALVTTEFGLIVAIPSLLLHAFLFRKARGVVAQMESTAISFANNVSRAADRAKVGSAAGSANIVGAGVPDPDMVRRHITEILSEMLGPLSRESIETRTKGA